MLQSDGYPNQCSWRFKSLKPTALAYTQMGIYQEIESYTWNWREGRHSHLRRERDRDLESILPLAPRLPDSFRTRNLSSLLDSFFFF